MDLETGLPSYPDNFFDLAILDPPYGIGEANAKRMLSRHHSQAKYRAGDWDKDSPNEDYFKEVFRVSKNQIIWGANHFISKIPYDSSCWIWWDKDRFGDFADGELAWTSFKTAVRKAKYTWDGFRKQTPEIRIHPTQKPVALYRWLLENYAKPGQMIVDTHVGSASSLIACESMGFDYVAWEIDAGYYADAKNRMSKGIQGVLL